MMKLTPAEITSKPEDGVYVYGFFLEGARWNADKMSLDDSLPKKLFSQAPAMHFQPVRNREKPTEGIYRCPVYKILTRWGVLATTGHSSNFILWLEIPSDRNNIKNNLGLADQDVWIKAGVAAFCSLKY